MVRRGLSQSKNFDVIVIGSGPGGEGAAMQAAKLKLRVAIIEKHPLVGGSCTHLGTIPSKTLRHMAHQLVTFKSDPLLTGQILGRQISFREMLEHAKDVISEQVLLRSTHYSRNHVELIHGRAVIDNPNTVHIDKGYGLSEYLSAKNIILAPGSRPYHPPDIDFSHKRVLDSDTILDLSSDPQTIAVYGAGVIGCEYTSIFRALGKKVTLINSRSKLLSFLDDEIVDALSYHLRDQGVMIRHNEFYESVELRDDSVIVTLKSGKRVRADILMLAMGRVGNSEGLGLEKLGIETDQRGYIQVDENMQTAVPNIYAVGDVVGFPSLASAAYDQGRFAALHILDPASDDSLVKDIPLGIYTSPEISSIGKTETQLTAARIPYEVGQASFRHLARAQITGRRVGMLKILFNSQTLEILGIHCFGQNASEIIHIGQTVMAQKNGGNTIKYFVNTTFNYPTMAEAYRVAALNGLNRVC